MSPMKVFFLFAVALVAVMAVAADEHNIAKKQVYTGIHGAALPYAAYPYAAYPYAAHAAYPYAAQGAYYPYAYGHDDGSYFPGKYGPES